MLVNSPTKKTKPNRTTTKSHNEYHGEMRESNGQEDFWRTTLQQKEPEEPSLK